MARLSRGALITLLTGQAPTTMPKDMNVTEVIR